MRFSALERAKKVSWEAFFTTVVFHHRKKICKKETEIPSCGKFFQWYIFGKVRMFKARVQHKDAHRTNPLFTVF
jgi:hypothetical protein